MPPWLAQTMWSALSKMVVKSHDIFVLAKMAASLMAASILFLQLLPAFTELSKEEGRGDYKTEQSFAN